MTWYPIRTVPKQDFEARDVILAAFPRADRNVVRVEPYVIGPHVVASLLTAFGRIWAPMEYEVRAGQNAKGRTVKRRVPRPLTTGYLFASEPIYPVTLELERVILGPVMCGGVPGYCGDRDLIDLAALDRKDVKAGAAATFAPGQDVLVALGLAADIKGSVAYDDEHGLGVRLDMLGKSVVVPVDRERVQRAPERAA